MSTLLQIAESNDTLAQSCMSGLLTLREKLSSTVDKLTEWLANAEDTTSTATEYISVKLPDTIAGSGEAIARLTPEIYRQAMDDEEALLSLYVNDAGDYITATGAEILDAVETATEEAQLQGEFIDYCMRNEQVHAHEFIGSLTDKFQFVTADIANRFSTFISTTEPLTAIQTFMSTLKNFVTSKQTVGENEYITVSSTSDYTGTSVCAIMWDQFIAVRDRFIVATWKGIFHIGEFLAALWDGILKLGRWLIGKLFKPLTTRFQVVGSVMGIMDLPIFQVKLGSYVINGGSYSITPSAEFVDHLNYMKDGSTPIYSRRPISFGANMQFGDWSNSWYNNYSANHVARLVSPMFEAVDGKMYVRPVDIIVPGREGGEFILRLGPTDEGDIYLQAYASTPKALYDSLNDKEIAQWLERNVSEMVGHISEEVPCLCHYPTAPDTMDDVLLALVGEIITPPNAGEGDDNYDLVAHLPYFDASAIRSTDFKTFLYIGVCAYMFRHSKALKMWYNPDIHNYADYNYATISGNAVTAGPDGSLDSYILYGSGFEDAYKPYLQRQTTPILVHYQTLTDQASEIWRYVIGIAIAILAVFVTVKFVKFRKKRTALAEIRNGNVDAKSWDLPINPSSEQIAEYNSLKRKARRTQKVNALLGLTSPLRTAADVASVASATRDMVLHTQQLASQTAATTGNGVSDTLSNTGTLLTNLSTLSGVVSNQGLVQNDTLANTGTLITNLAQLANTVSGQGSVQTDIQTAVGQINQKTDNIVVLIVGQS